MILFLLFFLIIFFILCYFLSGKDLFAPSTVQLLTFAGTVLMCIYFMWSVDEFYEFHWESIEIIALAMFLTTIIGSIVHQLFRRVKIHSPLSEKAHISPISSTVSIFCLGIILFTMVWLLIEIHRIGGSAGFFVEIMHQFHAINAYSTNDAGRLPWVLNQLSALVRVLFLIYGFNLIHFFNVLTVKQRYINFSILGLCGIEQLLTGTRMSVITLLISCFMFFHLLRIQKDGKYKQYHLKSLFRIALLLLMIMIGFFLTKGFVGRNGKGETINPASYLAYYTGTQYIAFDQYLQDPPLASTIGGKETFYSMIQFMIKYLSVDIQPYIGHKEFRFVGAGLYSNVYTFLRSYHYDFGMVGMYVLHSLSILFLSVFYEYTKKRRGDFGILIFGQMYYTIVMSFYAEFFYSTVFSVNYIKQLMMLIVLYELLIRKRIRLVLPWAIHRWQTIPSYARENLLTHNRSVKSDSWKF